MDIVIRKATTADLDLVTHIEATCFPPAEAAPREAFEERLKYYAGQFLIAFDGDTPIGFIDGFVTYDEILTDEMFADASLHNPNGAWQIIKEAEIFVLISTSFLLGKYVFLKESN
mgnify:CR=1 FL=1